MLEVTLIVKIGSTIETPEQRIICSFEEHGYVRTEFKSHRYFSIYWSRNNLNSREFSFWYVMYNGKREWMRKGWNENRWVTCNKPSNLEDMYEEISKQNDDVK